MKARPRRTRRAQKPSEPDLLPSTDAELPRPAGDQPGDEPFALAEDDGVFVPGPHWEGKTNFCPGVYWDDEDEKTVP